VHPFPGPASRRRHRAFEDSKAQAERVRAVAVQRVGVRVGKVPPAVMADLDGALRLHLAL